MNPWGRVLASVLLVAAAASFVPGVLAAWDEPWAFAALAVQGVTAVAAVLLLRVPELRSDGWWLVGGTVAFGAFFLQFPTFDTGYSSQVGWSLQYASAPFLAVPVLRLPDHPAAPRTVRLLTMGFLVVLVGLRAGSGLFWDPETMADYSGPGQWVTLFPWETVVTGVQKAMPFALAPVAVGFTVAQVRRHRRAAGPNRRAVRLLVWLTVPMMWGLVALLAMEAYGAPSGFGNVIGPVYNAIGAASLLVVLLVAVAANLRRAGFLDALLAAGGDATAIEAVLAKYVADPALRLRFRTEEGWTDAAGNPVSHVSPEPGRAFHPIVIEPDGPAVVADHDKEVDPNGRQVRPLLDAAGVVLARARLSVQQAAQAVELRASRARIVEAGVQQRRQLERDLHDGAQQHLLAAQAALARAGLGGEPQAVSEAIAFAQSRLVTTMAELRGLARGQHPALLSQAGLASALGSLAQLSGRVQVHVAPQLVGLRFAPVVEATAWFVASEGVVNALKYTDAGVKVTADVADGLRVQIIDTGDGGVDFTPGGGLAGLRDRVRGAGGTLTLDSPTGTGTTLTVTLPARPAQEET